MPLPQRFRAVIPPEVRRKLEEVERVLGRQVRIDEDPGLAGLAPAKINSDGSIFLAPTTAAVIRPDNAVVPNNILGVLGEEVMHLVRRAEMYPVIEPLQGAWNSDYDQ